MKIFWTVRFFVEREKNSALLLWWSHGFLHSGLCQKLKQPVFFRCCTFMDSDVYSADAPWSIPTLLTINVLSL